MEWDCKQWRLLVTEAINYMFGDDLLSIESLSQASYFSTVSDDVSDLSRRFHNNIQFVWIKSWLGRNFHRPTLALRVLWSITVVINTFQIWKLLNKTSHRQNTSYNPFCFLKDISGELFLNMTNWTVTTLSGVFQYYKNSLQVQLYRTYVHYRGDNWQFIVKILIKMVAQVDMIMW